jgi:drug/metabolite transporter (DMT)-like permease
MLSPTVVFALLSLVCAGANDVVFKRYAGKDRSRGAYVFGIGLVWVALQAAFVAGSGVGLDLSGTTLGYGAAAGVLLTASNLCLLESLTHIDASLGSTIYRLNTIGVVILSVLFLHETLGWLALLGVLLGIAAVFLLYRRIGHGEATGRRFALFFGLAVLASACRATYGVVSKAGLAAGATLQTMLVIAALCWIVGGAGYALLREKRLRMTRKKVAYSFVSGMLVFLIVNFLLLAIEYGQASIAIPIANMSFVVALLLSVGLGMEKLTGRKLVAVTLSVGSLLLLSLAQ